MGDGGTTGDDGATPGDGGAVVDGGSPAANRATVKIDGIDVPVTGFTSFRFGNGPFLSIKLARPGMATDIAITVVRRGTGCEVGGNGLTYRPDGDVQFFAEGAGCGLDVTSAPTKAGDRFVGVFRGSVKAGASVKQLDVTFDARLD